MRIRVVYGVHPSRCLGYSLGVDPLLPPKKCPYNCIYCPMGSTVVKTLNPSTYVKPRTVIDEIREFIEVNGVVFENIMVWGSGDPLLNYYTPPILSEIKRLLEGEGIGASLSLRTTGYLLEEEWARQILLYADMVFIPLDSNIEFRKEINDPVENAQLYRLSRILRGFPRSYKKKIWFEINLLRTSTYTNASLHIIEELITVIYSSGISKIIVKTIDRPGRKKELKPVKGRQFEKIVKRLTDEGFQVKECTTQPQRDVIVADNSDEAILNHILRKPLSSEEIKKIYGVEGLRNAERLAAANILEKTTWNNKVYFRASTGITKYF